MAKQQTRNMGKPPISKVPTSAQTAQSSVSKDSLIKSSFPVWSASFKNASKVYGTVKGSLALDTDEQWLKSIINGFPEAEHEKFVAWIQRFADVCKELGSYRDKLDEEYEARWQFVNKLGRESEDGKQKLADEYNRFAKESAEFEVEKATFASRYDDLQLEKKRNTEKESRLLDQERLLREREINAEAGFAKQNEQSLRQLETHQLQLKQEYDEDIKSLRDERRKLEVQISQMTHHLEEVKHRCSDVERERIGKLDQRQLKIERDQEALERDRTILAFDSDELEKEWSNFNQRLDEKMAKERVAHVEDINRLEMQVEQAWRKAEQYKERLAGFQEFQQVFADRSPAEILEQMNCLNEEIWKLRRSMDQSDSAELQRDNHFMRNRVNDLESELTELRPKLEIAERENNAKRLAADQLEAVARSKRVLEQSNNILTVQIDALESRIEKLTNAQKTQTPFPAMSQMDMDKAFRISMEHDDVPNLEQFAKELQHRIAKAEKHVELFYPLDDIRILISGLAMSQLHVFQGISGTGKTSLAKAFAKAVGGFCTDIAVQAGWRDRDDLLGHYNAFERRFYEKDCLQALYQAQTPRWLDTCNIILLDEMNLSRPEQYFAEFLSALEKNNKEERLISLSETALPNAPIMLKDGRKILVPENIWFIGTANHDETTNNLADKTYDRAHVMTLPKQDERFVVEHMDPTSFSYSSLRKSFQKAQAQHKTDVKELLSHLTHDDFTKQLESKFGLGWGNRFEKQALDFIPVLLATGGSKGQALDHLLSTRVMRAGKVTGLYDKKADDLRALKGELESFWCRSNLENEPYKSFDLLDTDIQRLEERG